MSSSKVSNARFKINAYIRLAALLEPDDFQKRQQLIDEATSLLENMDSFTVVNEPSEKQIEFQSIVNEIAEKSTKLEYMTVTDFLSQDCRLAKFDPSYAGRMLSDMGYTKIARGRLNSEKVQPRLRLLPIKVKEDTP